MGHERPAVMVLSDKGAKKFAAATPPPMREVGMCTGPHKTDDLGVHYTPVGELHLEQAWNGQFGYTTARSTSFQVGIRAEGGSWSAGGSTSSVKGHSSETGNDFLPGNRMYSFAADIVYKRFTWKCNRAETWRWVESVEPVEWGGGLRRNDQAVPPTCTYRSPIPPRGYHKRGEGESITLEGAVAVSMEVNRWLDGQFRVEEGNTGKVPGQILVASGFDDERETALVPYRHGEEYVHFLSLHNRGRDVKVLGFPGEMPHALLRRVEIRVDLDPGRRNTSDDELANTVPFKPFTLKRDQEVWFYFRSRFEDCEFFSGGVQWGVSSLPVKVKALWSTRTVSVPLRNPLVVTYGTGDRLFSETVLGPGCPG